MFEGGSQAITSLQSKASLSSSSSFYCTLTRLFFFSCRKKIFKKEILIDWGKEEEEEEEEEERKKRMEKNKTVGKEMRKPFLSVQSLKGSLRHREREEEEEYLTVLDSILIQEA